MSEDFARAAQDYTRIEQAIHYLEQHYREQPSLAAVAAHVGLSEFHFQRLFQRWAGISPKRFIQFLTADLAESLLREPRPLLDVTLESGLSSVSRLHGLFVNLHAMTPAEWRDRGAGLKIRYGVHPSPFGDCLVALTDKGICALRFVGPGCVEQEISVLTSEWRGASFVSDIPASRTIVQQVFAAGKVQQKPLSLAVRGTNFRIKVWEALLRIPPGSTTTYSRIAQQLGMPKSARAVGRAIGSNSVAMLIPCHRVIRESGPIAWRFGGYRWGETRKKALLAWEAAQAAPAEPQLALG